MNRRLTATILTALRAKQAAYYVSDDQQAGLRVRVAPSGLLTWNIAFRIKGKPATKSVSLGVCDPYGRKGLSLTEARERASAILKAARQGRDLIEEEARKRVAEDNRVTVEKLIERYSKAIGSPNRKGGALRTAPDIERRLTRALVSKLKTPAEELSRADVSDLLDDVAEKYAREAEKRRQVIGAMFRWGVAKGYVTMDPTAGTEGYERGTPGERVLSPDEIKALWAWLDAGAENMPPDCIVALRLQLCTGARIGEVSGIEASELRVEGDRLIWILPRNRSKNKQERTTPLIGKARDIVEAALESRKRGALFRTAISDRALTSADIGHALKVRRRKLPFPGFCSHDLRRTVVSVMDELGIPLDTIAAVIGHQRGSHQTRTLIKHYSRPNLDDRIEAALSAWDARLTQIIEGQAEQNDDKIVRLRA